MGPVARDDARVAGFAPPRCSSSTSCRPSVPATAYEYGVPGAVHGTLAPTPTPATAAAGGGGAGLGNRAGAKRVSGGSTPMKEVLVVANRTLGGAKLLDAVRARGAPRAASASARRTAERAACRPRDLGQRPCANRRRRASIGLALSLVAGEGIDATGEGHPRDDGRDCDAAAETRWPFSTHPAVSSGWLRRDLIKRIPTRGACRSSTSSSTSSTRACRST